MRTGPLVGGVYSQGGAIHLAWILQAIQAEVLRLTSPCNPVKRGHGLHRGLSKSQRSFSLWAGLCLKYNPPALDVLEKVGGDPQAYSFPHLDADLLRVVKLRAPD